jgi:hypothetical protein
MASVMASLSMQSAPSRVIPHFSQNKASVGIRGMETVGQMNSSSFFSTVPLIRTVSTSSQ